MSLSKRGLKTCFRIPDLSKKIQSVQNQVNKSYKIESLYCWVEKLKKMSKKFTFLQVRHGPIQLQCISTDTLPENLKLLSNIFINGTLTKVDQQHHCVNNVEIQLESIKLADGADDTSIDLKRNNLPIEILETRMNPEIFDIVCVKKALKKSLAKILDDFGFLEVDAPTLTSTVFESENLESVMEIKQGTLESKKRLFLTQSNQLYLETLLPALGNVFCIEKCFRNEIKNSFRHLEEFDTCEAEMSIDKFDNLINSFITIISKSLQSMAKILPHNISKKIRDKIKERNNELSLLKIMHFYDGLKLLEKENIINSNKEIYFNKFTAKMELQLLEIVKKPILLSYYPNSDRPFYAKKHDEQVCQAFDLLLPGIGEVASGSMRENNIFHLKSKLEKNNMLAKSLKWYTTMQQNDMMSHGGFGIGIERLLMFIIDCKSIKSLSEYKRSINGL
ncbi:MAG: asparagine--tRNA ligase [Paramarteilia canceri]